ncbi:hypothetical protein [Bacillus sp. FJAT-22090]|uniref:hypothetical protein n=1 Tax=Bacillus sp. FJAT-22090 TaxID=1581038 RepID=UPI001642C70C|nr:hypothetical protein [Bacillus sp. FJAT-22090]
MYPNQIDSEEMAMRKNLDVIASLNMIDEGGPVYYLEQDNEASETNATEPK